MAGFTESNSVQAPLIARLVAGGWRHVPGPKLAREVEQPFVESDLRDALVRLNPEIAKDPSRADEVLRELRTVVLTVADEGLVASNRAMTEWMRGRHTLRYVGSAYFTQVRLVDFEHPENNSLVVSHEVSYGPPGHSSRFDIVLWVNGLPVVVGETKSPVNSSVSWVTGARDVSEVYEKNQPGFFVTNVFSFATEGKEFMYGAVGASVDHWHAWGSTADDPLLTGWKRVERCTDTLLSPRTVLDMLEHFTLFETSKNSGGVPRLIKIAARYPQYEAVNLIAQRVHEQGHDRGLIYHTQGSGKTFAMVFAAVKLLTDESLANPTIVLIADRVQLVRQTYDQFRTSGMPALQVPESAEALRRLLVSDQRGLVFSTVHKFSGAGVLNGRANIVVLIDETHRTQEGGLGQDMRSALPNAQFFGFTGTPIADNDHDTFALYGDPTDENRTLHAYDQSRSIADGMTVPIHVNPRVVDFQFATEDLDIAFDELTRSEGLTEDQADLVSRKASRVSTLFAAPDRIEAVCQDIVEHFYSHMDPLGMKAQVVAVDRAMVVAYTNRINELLAKRVDGARLPDEAAAVMTVTQKDPTDWQGYALTDEAESALLERFRTFGDPLKFLIVTSKLGTGFDAPIEGVMYLDKPLKMHTLFQTITRTNRLWRNKETGQEKRFGLICDYVGLGEGFARAMKPANPDDAPPRPDLDSLVERFVEQLDQIMVRFVGIDHEHVTAQTLQDALNRVPPGKHADMFASEYLMLNGIWELAWPDDSLAPYRADYKFLSQTYQAAMPSGGANELLWHRLGAKTLELVHAHMSDVRVTASPDQVVIADAETIRDLAKKLLDDPPADPEDRMKAADELIDSIAARIRKKLAGSNGDHPVYRSLAERLDTLRNRVLAQAQASEEFLKEMFDVATDLKVAESAEADDGRTGLDLLPDPNIGALTQIFREYAPKNSPVVVEKVVREVDEIVGEVRFDGWASTQKGDQTVRRALRKVLKSVGLPVTGELFDKAYRYIAKHY